jgi:hypothetical protein
VSVRGGAAAAWTGGRMVVFASNSPGGPAAAAIYSPRSNTWRRLPSGPLGSRESYASVWTGRELLVFGGNSGDAIATPTAAALNPRTGTWGTLRTLDAVKGLMPNAAVWTGREAFVSGSRFTSRKATPILIAYNPATDTLRRINLSHAPANTRQRLEPEAIGWTDGKLISSTTTRNGTLSVLLYDPANGTWTKAKAAPCRRPANGYSQTAWIGTRLVAACGATRLQIYTPRGDAWKTTAPGPSPVNSRESSAIVWTGHDLIAWSGTVYKPNNPALPTGASLTLIR